MFRSIALVLVLLFSFSANAHPVSQTTYGYHCWNDNFGHTYPDVNHCDGTIQVGWHVEWTYWIHPSTYGGLPPIGTVITKYIEMEVGNALCMNFVYKWKAVYIGNEPSTGQPIFQGYNGKPKTTYAYTVQDWHSPECYGGGGDPG